MSVNVTFRGVRGSTPCCSADYNIYGGNTACVELDFDGKIVVFANRIPIASAAITPCGRSKIIMQYKVHDANSQTLSINFSGKGTFDLYTIEFKE